jgi:outer membrane protein assembly factor BamB
MLLPAWLAPITLYHFIGAFWGPVIAAFALLIWWLFASRVRWADRLLGAALFVGAVAAVAFLSGESFPPIGLLGYALPATTTAVVLWLVLAINRALLVRRLGLVLVLLIGLGWLLFVRVEGVDGSMAATFQPRWTVSAQKQAIADRQAARLSNPAAEQAANAQPIRLLPGDWPGFRGPNRDGRLARIRIATDWDKHPPTPVWRHRIGLGWSSFAVVGSRIYTQEQLEKEAVVCFSADSGTELWSHQDEACFNEAMGGSGPRATPTFHDGKIYAQGATGILNCLDATTGKLIWKRDVLTDAGAALPTWGYAASPLVTHGLVVVFGGGPAGKSVLAYDSDTGAPKWSAGEGQFSYCSLHPVRMNGVEQVLIATGEGLTSYEPTTGTVLWQHAWQLTPGMSRVVQPTLIGDSDVLIGTGFGYGTRRIHVSHAGDGWTTQELWTCKNLKPYYNDQVVHKGHIYGFNNEFLTCVGVDDGVVKWRERGYGNGQLLLLEDQDLMLVLSEKGVVALVEVTPYGRHELARFQAINGKTWNHPVIAHGKLFVRNAEEAACYTLSEEGTSVAKDQ